MSETQRLVGSTLGENHQVSESRMEVLHSAHALAQSDVWLDSEVITPPPESIFAQQRDATLRKSEAEQKCAQNGRSWKDRFLDFIEGPWAPHYSDLPSRRSPEESGNSKEPFRTHPGNTQALRERCSKERFIKRTRERYKISPWTTVFEYVVPLGERHRELSGIDVLHLSDIHLLEHSTRPTAELERVADVMEASRRSFDLVVFSGDLITASPRDLSDRALRAFQRITSRAQVSLFVLGNHDYHGHTPAVVTSWIREAGFFDITNQTVDLKRGHTTFSVHGVDDAYFGAPTAPDVLDSQRFNLLLTHNLDAIRANFPGDVDLILSGHTHWGELRLFNAARIMRAWGYCDDVNQHTRGWSALTDRSLSFVHPGLARYYVPYPGLRHPPGIVIHRLRTLN